MRSSCRRRWSYDVNVRNGWKTDIPASAASVEACGTTPILPPLRTRRDAWWFTSRCSGPTRRVAPFPPVPRPNFAAHGVAGPIISPRLVQDDADLVLLELRQRQ